MSAQLTSEFREFFPHNAVHYFIAEPLSLLVCTFILGMNAVIPAIELEQPAKMADSESGID